MRPYISNSGAGARVEHKTKQKAHERTSGQLESQIQTLKDQILTWVWGYDRFYKKSSLRVQGLLTPLRPPQVICDLLNSLLISDVASSGSSLQPADRLRTPSVTWLPQEAPCSLPITCDLPLPALRCTGARFGRPEQPVGFTLMLDRYIRQKCLFQCYVVRCGFKNWHQKDTCLREVGVHVQIMIIVLGSIINGQGDLYDHLMSMRIFILIMNKMFIFMLQKL